MDGAGCHRSRRPRLPARAVLPVLFALAALTGGCADPDSVVLVEVDGQGLSGIMRLRASVTVGLDTRVLLVPTNPQAIPLPTSFTVQIDGSRQGSVGIAVEALDANQAVLARGEALIGELLVGQTNELQVTLEPVAGGAAGAAD
jgi:hypothetical protein